MSILRSAKKDISRVNILSYFELNELPKLLLPGEQIEGVISGFYSVGPATLCVTSERLLLVDKKFIRLIIEDIRFDSLGEIQYSQQLFLSSVRLIFAGQTLQFRSFYRRELRAFIQYVQFKTLKENATDSNPVHTVSERTFTDSTSLDARQENSEAPLTMNQRFHKWRKATEYIGELQLARKAEEVL